MRALLCLVFIAGCTKKNPNYCDDEPDHVCRDSGGMACTSSNACTGAEKICKLPEQVCVECTTAEASACMGTKPVCVSDKCAPCTKHTDCPASLACMPDGSCASASDVVYVKEGSTNNATCSIDMQCGDVQAALAVTPPKTTIKVEGTINAATITFNRDVLLLGQDATLRNTGNDVMTLDGTSKVRLYDITVTGAAGNIGINSLATHTGELELQHCTVTRNATGIKLAGNTSSLILSRSTVSLNTQGGVDLTGTSNKFDITNNFIFRNGNTNDAPVGGVRLDGTTAPATSRFEFNTVVDNQTTTGSGRVGGVKCDIQNFAAPNNIIARNSVATMTTLSTQTFGICAFIPGSQVQADVAGLNFVQSDQLDYNYRITAGSVVVDRATTGAQVMVDVDGESRPNGTARDYGADELH